LCHISEFGTREKMESSISVGNTYQLQILDINVQEHRMSLKLVQPETKGEEPAPVA
ncbi:MAG: hypothetical protein HYW96_01150, partial [Candidatus Wildermuthbacteria bacterium]|nr:hypothetical protein [Candidatus Wildermuthbacteria bacterium]